MQPSSLRHALEESITDMVEEIMDGKIQTSRVVCRYCGSEIVWKYGKNRSGVQRWKCPVCGKVFLEKDALPQMRVTVRQLGDVLGQYFGGLSLKEVKRQFLQQHKEPLSRSSFDRWITKFSKIAVAEAEKQHPKVGSIWLADECVLKIGGRKIWCWDIIDSDTRFLLATHLSPTRTTKDAQELMEKAQKQNSVEDNYKCSCLSEQDTDYKIEEQPKRQEAIQHIPYRPRRILVLKHFLPPFLFRNYIRVSAIIRTRRRYVNSNGTVSVCEDN